MSEMDKLGKKPKRRIDAWQPVIGALIALVAAVFAALLAESAVDVIDSRAGANFPPSYLAGTTEIGGGNMPFEFEIPHVNFVGGAILWIAFVLVASVIVAAAIPKKKSIVTDKSIAKERAEAQQEYLRQKKKRKKMAQARLQDNLERGESLGRGE